MAESLSSAATTGDQQVGAVEAPRLVHPGRAGYLASIGTNVRVSWLAEQYDLSMTALRYVGPHDRGQVPTLRQIQEGLRPADVALLSERVANGCMDELVITPSVQNVGLVGSEQEPGLVRRYDRTRGPAPATRVSEDLWGKFDDKDTVHDNDEADPFTVAILFNDNADPRDETRPVNRYGEPGLVYTDLSSDEQRDAFVAERQAMRDQHNTLIPATVGQIIMVNLQRRATSRVLTDTRDTATRLIHYPSRIVDGQSSMPTTAVRNRQLMLIGSDTLSGADNVGIRRGIQIAVETH